MAYFHLLIKDVVIDEYEGSPRIRAHVEEANPRSYNMNLTKASADVINKIQSLKGQMAMVPARDGIMNGQPFLSLLPGEIIPLTGAQPSSAASISNVNPVKELDPVPVPEKTAASPLFKSSANK